MSLVSREAIIEAGRAAGLTAAGIASCEPSGHAEHLERWLARGAHAGMDWMATTAATRKDLVSFWDWARTALVGVSSYLTAPADRRELPGLSRHIARYARGRDYHDVLKRRLNRWGDRVEKLARRPVRRIALVDTSAVLERELAWRAGLGWFGKNTCLIGEHGDSWRFIGVLLVDLALPVREEPLNERCGSCRACLDACPTGAITEPWFVDAGRCISYWTIEHRGPFPEGVDREIGDWLFGCDVCQDVCPWNRRATVVDDPAFAPDPRYDALMPRDLLRMDDAEFRATFRGTPLARTKREGLARNARAVLGNTKT